MLFRSTTGVTTGGVGQQMEHFKTGANFEDSRFAYMARLDLQSTNGDEADAAVHVKGKLAAATSLTHAAEIVEGGLAAKLSKSLNMPIDDLDTAKPVHSYGVDSLVAIEVRNVSLLP